MAHQFVFGLLAPRLDRGIRKQWNDLIREQGIDGFFDFYRTKDRSDLELRLSEMFHLERRGYIVDPALQTLVVPLLDRIDASSQKSGRVDTVVNERGVLAGYFCPTLDPCPLIDLFLKQHSKESA